MIAAILILLACTQAQAETLTRQVETFNRIATRGVGFPCDNDAQVLNASYDGVNASTFEVGRVLVDDKNGVARPVSVIALEDLTKLREAIYPGDFRTSNAEVCAARAHLIGKALADNGLESVKIMMWPGGILPAINMWPFRGTLSHKTAVDQNKRTPEWKYHMVNMIMVDTGGGKLERYVIDPYVRTSQPIPYTQWKEGFNNPGFEETLSRYNFGPAGKPDDTNDNLNNYSPNSLEWAKNDLRGFLRK